MLIKSGVDFRDEDLLHSRRKLMRRGSFLAPLFTLAAITITGCAPQASHLTAATPLIANMGGYSEDHTTTIFSDEEFIQLRARYLKEASELTAAIKECDQGRPSCDPEVKKFSAIIKYLKKIKNKSFQIFMINAITNAYLIYDDQEAQNIKSNLEGPSLLKTIKTHYGICYEYGKIKLYLAEALGYNPNSEVRLVEEDIYNPAQSEPCDEHAVIEINNGRQFFIMNDNNVEDIQSLNAEDILSYTIRIGRMETAEAQLNISLNDMWDEVTFYIPSYEYSSTQMAPYKAGPPRKDLRNVPQSALHAKRNILQLDNKTLQALRALDIMKMVYLSREEKIQKENLQNDPQMKKNTTTIDSNVCNTAFLDTYKPKQYAALSINRAALQ